MENRNPNEEQRNRTSESSVDSNPELKDNKVYYLRISLIIINIISVIIGIYIFKNNSYYLSPDYKFEYKNSLFIYLVMYSLGMIGSLIFSFIFSLITKVIVFVVNLFSKDESKQLTKNEQQHHSENSFGYINSIANEFAILPYMLTMFIICTAIIYLLSLPYSIFLFIFLNKNKFYSYLNNFIMLYLFIIINGIAGLILFYILLIVIFVKRNGSFRQRNYFIDDENLNNLRNEIRGAMQKAESDK